MAEHLPGLPTVSGFSSRSLLKLSGGHLSSEFHSLPVPLHCVGRQQAVHVAQAVEEMTSQDSRLWGQGQRQML